MMPAEASSTGSGKGSARKRIAPLVSAITLVLVLIALFAPLLPALTLEDVRAGRTIFRLPIRRGETFRVRFTHSLNLSDVTDTIEWTGETLVCRSTLFTAYGAGIPDLSDGIGTGFAVTEEGFLLTGIDKPETEILILLQTVPNHRLLYRDKTCRLLALCGSGALVSLKVERASPLSLLYTAVFPPWDGAG